MTIIVITTAISGIPPDSSCVTWKLMQFNWSVQAPLFPVQQADVTADCENVRENEANPSSNRDKILPLMCVLSHPDDCQSEDSFVHLQHLLWVELVVWTHFRLSDLVSQLLLSGSLVSEESHQISVTVESDNKRSLRPAQIPRGCRERCGREAKQGGVVLSCRTEYDIFSGEMGRVMHVLISALQKWSTYFCSIWFSPLLQTSLLKTSIKSKSQPPLSLSLESESAIL